MRKIVIAITGASGSIYAKLLLDKVGKLNQHDELAIVITENARQVWQTELGNEDYKSYSFRQFKTDDFSAPFASGSGQFDTMIIIPCSMALLAELQVEFQMI